MAEEDNRQECKVIITFAGPGSANIIGVSPVGMVSPFQLWTAAKFLDVMAEENYMVQRQQQVEIQQRLAGLVRPGT